MLYEVITHLHLERFLPERGRRHPVAGPALPGGRSALERRPASGRVRHGSLTDRGRKGRRIRQKNLPVSERQKNPDRSQLLYLRIDFFAF